jgi:hypothetical protein
MSDLLDSTFALVRMSLAAASNTCRAPSGVRRVKIPQAEVRNSRLQHQVSLHISAA